MKKQDFVTLVFGTVGGLLFALGMCMALLPEWNAFVPGCICTGIGFVVLLTLILVRCRKSGKKIKVNWKLIGKVTYGVISSLVLGLGMCMILVWDMMLVGIAVGVVGIVMLLFLIPMFVGLK